MAYVGALPNSNTFIRPVYPGDFTVTVPIDLRDSAVVLTTPDIAQLKDLHDEMVCLYNECQSVEQTT